MRQFSLLLLLVLLIMSCNGQHETRLSKGSEITGQPKIHLPQGIVYDSIYGNIHCGLQDRAGNLWFCTTGAGVFRYDGKSFVNFTTKEGLCNNIVYAIAEDKAGNIWFGTNDGPCRYDGKTFTQVPTSADGRGHTYPSFSSTTPANAPLASIPVFSMLCDRAGTVWLGTADGIYRYNGVSFTDSLFIANNSLRRNVIQCIWEDKSSNLWFGSWSNKGAYRFDGKLLTNFTTKDGLSDNMVSSFGEDKAGNILIGTRDFGLCRYDGKSFTNITIKDGLCNNNISSITKDKEGNLWFSHDGVGVCRYDGKVFTNFTTKDGLGNNNVFCIIKDKSGALWFGTRRMGLTRYDGKTMVNFSEKRPAQ